ncbi:MAG: response regulator [Ignavibacteriaceae bacterium]|jgi:CheY-like chemotaxis protein|nr:response regulator [Ignavibacteriaceae bacterium]
MESNKTTRFKILIVEDDFTSQELFKLLLGKKYSITICNGEKGFFTFIERTRADVVLMDISLSGDKNGLELIQYLRKQSIEHKHTPIICYSAHVFSQDKINAFNAGADIFLPKPVSNEVLIETIEMVLLEAEKIN